MLITAQNGSARQAIVARVTLSFVFIVSSFCPSPTQAKVSEKEKFGVRVIEVKRGTEGCSADVRSDTVYYHVSSAASGDCAFLRAGESYKAFIFSGHREGADLNDRSADKVVLVIEDNKEQGKSSVVNIDSEEVESKK